MKENNNAYISELNSKYPEIKKWAAEFGFTIDELAWIQPCYCSASGAGVLNVTCYGGNDGYFVPNPSGGVSPYTFNGWYGWDGTSWILLPCGGCDLVAGSYKCTVTDAVGTVQDYFATITQPAPISQAISYTNDNGSCNGTAAVAASGGTPGYTYSWTPGGSANDTITNLCAGTYSLTITDNNGCTSTGTVTISIATTIESASESTVEIFPNPVSDNLNLKLSNFFLPDKTFVTVYNAIGRQILYKKIGCAETSIDLSNLDNGIYFIGLDNGMEIKNYPLIKEK